MCRGFRFEKGFADRGGWREKTLQRPEIQTFSLYPFSYAPLGERGHISGELFGLFLGVCLSPAPSRQPLFETSDFVVEILEDSAGHLFYLEDFSGHFFSRKMKTRNHR